MTVRGIEIRGYFRHFVPWDQIRGMNTSGYGGSRSIDDRIEVRGYGRPRGYSTSGRRARLATLRVVRVRGNPMLLRAPLVKSWAPDPEFDAKARELREFCVQYARGDVA